MSQADSENTTPSAPSRGALQSINQLRKDAADRIERLIGFLDATDADPDREDNGDGEAEPDEEPSLGWTEQEARWGKYAPIDQWHCDGELQDEDDEDSGDREPSLGAPEADEGSQVFWAQGGVQDYEHDPAESGIGDNDGLMEQMRGAR